MEKKFEVSEFALEAVRHFEFSGTLINVRPFGNGHINDTYLAEYDIFGMGQVKVIIQRMNRNVFKQPEELMENIVNVTEFLKKKIEKSWAKTFISILVYWYILINSRWFTFAEN